MKSTLGYALVAILLAVPWTAAGAADSAQFDLLKAMSVADYRATGLDSLSDAQVKALSAWFANYEREHGINCGPAALAAPADKAVPLAAVSKPAPAASAAKSGAGSGTIVSYLDGSFTGWSGDTHFKLDNGQVWVQTDDSLLSIAPIRHPKVTINKGIFNAYYLSVEGVNDSVQVQRIQP
jgi:hypothetical protein